MGLESVSASEDVIGDQGEGGCTAGSVISMYLSLSKKNMVRKGLLLTRKEAKARLGRVEVKGGENFKWMGRETKKSVGRLPTEYQEL